jgi:hypothetical protein
MGEGSAAAPTPSGARVAFGFADIGVGEALAVASGFVAVVSSSAGAVAPAGLGVALGFAGTGAGKALAVASAFLAVVSSGEAVGSAVAATP